MDTGFRRLRPILLLAAVCFCLAAALLHVTDNLLSYDEEHHFDREQALSSGENGDAARWYIEIDLDRFRLSVYRDDQLIRAYPCSGGKIETPSPTGEFKIVNKAAWGEGFGGAWMGLDVPWGVFGIHGTKFPWVVGKKHASKGCIRMLTKDAKELYLMVPCGTRVTIKQKNKPFATRFNGDKGSEIWDAEVALHDLGYYDGEFDGKFGDKLGISITRFQQDKGLTATGSLNKKTYDRMMGEWKKYRDPDVD